eukprot:CAMPEP_0204036928 /NCGR_PEP_ID=MMETSP0360-20130528/81689_1 /ASSEMBLY_ACC=CAM_ASM_000342 /TAXON_ID=268821 /ORGANISM="Scrippsiella Hangoei, Strain SHTV-5" /LENGTH=42 /DNA_ID= /DNA_START= /DNA_END= /DNA_ORIENTATION=
MPQLSPHAPRRPGAARRAHCLPAAFLRAGGVVPSRKPFLARR